MTAEAAATVVLRHGIPRPLELFLAAAAFVLALPLVLLAAAAILATDGPPVFFRQERVGRGGKIFGLWKLRTMRNTRGSGPLVTSLGDRRVTPAGRILRRHKIDELPNLWSVLAGDLALVGPRPEVPLYVDLSDVRWQRVLEVRPGLTDPVTRRLLHEERLLATSMDDPESFYLEILLPWKLERYEEALRSRTPLGDLLVLAATVFPRSFSKEIVPVTIGELRDPAAQRAPVRKALT